MEKFHKNGKLCQVIEWLKKKKETAIQKIKLLLKKGLLYWHKSYFKFRIKLRKTKRDVSEKSGFYRRSLILLAFVLIWLLFLIHISYLNDGLYTYFISAGAMLGSVLAVTFTISIFAQQRNADLYSSKFFNVYIHNWIEVITYFAIICLVLFMFFIGLNFTALSFRLGSNLIVNFSLFLVLVVFTLIDFQYEDVRKKSDPTNALIFLEKQGLKSLESTHKEALKIAKMLRLANPVYTVETSIAVAYDTVRGYLDEASNYILSIYEISNRLFNRGETVAAKIGFLAITNLVAKFLEQRKNTFLVTPSPQYFLAVQTDAQRFLVPVLENLNYRGEEFVRNKSSQNASYIVDVYKKILQDAKNPGFVNRTNENPIFDQVLSYLSMYIDFAIRNDDQEVMFNGLHAYELAGKIAIEENLQESYYAIPDYILAIANQGLISKKTFLTNQAFDYWHQFIRHTFLNESFCGSQHMDKIIKDIAKVSITEFTYYKAGYLTRKDTDFSLTRGFSNYIETISFIFTRFEQLTADQTDSKDFYVRNILELFDEISSSIREVSEAIKSADDLLTETIGRLLYSMNQIIIQLLSHPDFSGSRIKPELEKILYTNIHLPTWFVHHSVKIDDNNNFDSLVESVAKTGIALQSLEEYTSNRMKDCIDSEWSIIKNSFDKLDDKYGYTLPRMMLRICYFGILAMKNADHQNVQKVKEYIAKFQEMYKKRFIDPIQLPDGVDPATVHGLPTANRLETEIVLWRREFLTDGLNSHGLRDDAQSWMYSIIVENDIDLFTLEVWGFPIEEPQEDEDLESSTEIVNEEH